jgi:hypothetical protein
MGRKKNYFLKKEEDFFFKEFRCMHNHLVNIVILNYNGVEYLKKIIPPILNLDYSNYEIIVVDNGSSDESIIFLKKFNSILIIENGDNLGYGLGKNIGVSKAKGEYVLLLDNDILINDRDILKKLIENYSSETAFMQITLVDEGENKTRYYGVYFPWHGITFLNEFIEIKKILNYSKKLVDIPAATGGCMFFKKSVWEEIGGFDESQMFNIDDVDIGPRSYLFGYKNVLFTKDYFIHLKGRSAVSVENFIFRFKYLFSGHARAMIKNYKYRNVLLRLPFLLLFIFIKTIRDVIKRKSIKIFYAFLFSLYLFIKNLQETLRQRKIIQGKRIIKDDIFLKIKSPKF